MKLSELGKIDSNESLYGGKDVLVQDVSDSLLNRDLYSPNKYDRV